MHSDTGIKNSGLSACKIHAFPTKLHFFPSLERRAPTSPSQPILEISYFYCHMN